MLIFFDAIFITLLMCGVIIGFIAWAVREHLAARRYRYLVRLAQQMKLNAPAHNNVGPQWSITYKEGRKQKTVTIPGATEAEALRDFVKAYAVGYGNVISSVKL